MILEYSDILRVEEFATLLGYQISAFWSPGMVVMELLRLLCCAVHFTLESPESAGNDLEEYGGVAW